MTKVQIIERYGQAYYDEHLKRSRERIKTRASSDREKYNAEQRAWRKANAAKSRAHRKKYYDKNTEARRALSRKLYHENAEKCRTRARAWKKANPERVAFLCSQKNARRAKAPGSHTLAEWRSVLEKHGYRCAQCGAKEHTTKDHIIPLAKGGTNYAFNLQPLCKTCNARKQAKYETKFFLANI